LPFASLGRDPEAAEAGYRGKSGKAKIENIEARLRRVFARNVRPCPLMSDCTQEH
jgi:hypothetical protein